MIAALTGAGLAAAAGLNAYIPFVALALLARFTDLFALPSGLTWMESTWAITLGIVLLIAEVVLDKVPAVDSINDMVQTLIRPSMGGLMAAATAQAANIDHSTWMTDHPWVPMILGAALAGTVHTGKATARPLINTASFGTGAPVISAVEDSLSVVATLVAIFWPIASVVIMAAVLIGVVGTWRIVRRLNGRGPQAPRTSSVWGD